MTILSGLPSAGVGALLTLLISRTVLSIYSFVGIIMLIGIVKRNAIMMIAMAALTGTLPVAHGFGAGAEARRPLGLAVVGACSSPNSWPSPVRPRAEPSKRLSGRMKMVRSSMEPRLSSTDKSSS